jgi:DNA-binding NarL/FixJ family response regulator
LEQHVNERKERIFIVEHETLMREGLRAMLTSHDSFQVVGEAADGMEVIRAIEKAQPNLILLELNLPRMSGITVLRNIRKQVQDAKILVLTMHGSQEQVMEVFRLGGNGYCLKEDICREELFVAIRNVLKGKPYVSPSILHSVLDVYLTSRRSAGNGPLMRLSTREKDILKLIGEGYSIRDIAEYFYISRRTAETHRYNIMKKLNLHKTSSLVRCAVENGLVMKAAQAG